MSVDFLRHWFDLLAIGVTFALVWLAWRTKLRVLVFLAAVASIVVCTSVLLVGPLVLAFGVFAAWKLRGYAIGWAVLIAIPLSIAGFWLRVPWPSPMPSGQLQHATATVGDVRHVGYIWGGNRTRGQKLRVPYEIPSLTFTPAGARAPITVRDTVDSGSVRGLTRRGLVEVAYAAGDPASARIERASRTYAQDLFEYVVEQTFGWAVVVIVVCAIAIALWRGVKRVVAPPGSLLGRLGEQQAELRRIAELPTDDARREAIEQLYGRRIPPELFRSERFRSRRPK